MQNLHFPRRGTAIILLAACLAILVATPLPCPAQTTPDSTVVISTNSPTEPYLDRKVGSSLERFSRWKARMNKEHFTEYLLAYTSIIATVAGLFFGFSAYRLSDPMAPYRLIKRRSLQLSFAIGGTLGIFAAVMQVPPNTIGKVSLLLLATGTGAVVALLATWVAFILLRLRSNHFARLDGRRITDRMRHA